MKKIVFSSLLILLSCGKVNYFANSSIKSSQITHFMPISVGKSVLVTCPCTGSPSSNNSDNCDMHNCICSQNNGGMVPCGIP